MGQVAFVKHHEANNLIVAVKLQIQVSSKSICPALCYTSMLLQLYTLVTLQIQKLSVCISLYIIHVYEHAALQLLLSLPNLDILKKPRFLCECTTLVQTKKLLNKIEVKPSIEPAFLHFFT